MHCPKCGEPLPGQVMWSVDLAQAAAAAPCYVGQVFTFNDAAAAAPIAHVDLVNAVAAAPFAPVTYMVVPGYAPRSITTR